MSTTSADVPNAEFDWQRQVEAAALVNQLVEEAAAANADISLLRQRMYDVTGTRLVDWLDSIVLNDAPEIRTELQRVGFESSDGREWANSAGLFPNLLVGKNPPATIEGRVGALWIKVANVDDFAKSWEGKFRVDMAADQSVRLRSAQVESPDRGANSPDLLVIERHGAPAKLASLPSAKQIAMAAKHRTSLAGRLRSAASQDDGFQKALDLYAAAAADLDDPWAADLFFQGERDYWMHRNRAARAQYGRQQELGLGWANHDHHTYRSSRACFHLLVAALEQMGFSCRERFYAGREAGWGAQVLEHAACGLVVFADVDLSPEEVAEDFAHQPLPERADLGTVGLWCQLHGESFLEAGMHHLECQFDFDAARQQLAEVGVETMAPFTDFPHLKQAFTEGEMWTVDEGRLQSAVDAGHITAEQADGFRRNGALGSHLEILQRDDGYKGFNQTGISEIITRTDPRKW